MDEILKSLQKSILKSETPPSADVYNVFIAEVNKAIRVSGYSRVLVADRMNDALGGAQVVTSIKLNKWLSAGTEQYMPVHFLPALCWATSSIEPANILLAPLMHSAIDQRGQLLQRYAQLSIDATDKAQQAEQLAADLIRLTRPE